jgi:SAM-dependent methyltransferase
MNTQDVPTTAGLGTILVDAQRIQRGERVLDIAAGTRNVAIPAAYLGASVVAADRTRQLYQRGRRLTANAGAELVEVVAGPESLPFRDDLFDVATSCLGLTFTEHHQKAVDELVRVVRPGGRVGLLNWTPSGRIGRALARLPVAEAWATGTSSAPLWGDEAHVRDLLGDRVDDLTAVRGTLHVEPFAAPDVFRSYIAIERTPIAARLRYADRDARRIRLSEALDDLVLGMAANEAMEWEYLLVVATVR